MQCFTAYELNVSTLQQNDNNTAEKRRNMLFYGNINKNLIVGKLNLT